MDKEMKIRKQILLIILCLVCISILGITKTNVSGSYMGIPILSLSAKEKVINHLEREDNPEYKLFYQGNEMVKDNSYRFYLSISNKASLDERILSTDCKGASLYFIGTKEEVEKGIFEQRHTNVLLIDGNKWTELELVFTDFPVIAISFEENKRNIPLASEDVFSKMRMEYVEDNQSKALDSYCLVHSRGATSKAYMKQGLKMELITEKGKKNNKNLLNLRDDDDWVLIPLYVDESKIRDKVCIDLWNALSNRERNYNSGSEMKFVELILNKQYFGIYGLTTPIDKKQARLVDNKQYGDILFRMMGTSFDINALDSAGDNLTAGGIKIKVPSKMNQEVWNFIKDQLDLIYFKEDEVFKRDIARYIDMDNMVDAYIFFTMIYGKDNTMKNLNYCLRMQEDGSHKLSIIPWDMDLSFGLLFNTTGDSENGDRNASREAMLQKDSVCMLLKRLYELDVNGFRNQVKDRYLSLRKDLLSDSYIEEQIDGAMQSLLDSGAYQRDEQAWPDGNHNRDTQMLKQAFQTRVEFMDTKLNVSD